MDINLEKTELLKNDPAYKSYLSWLLQNGCIFPSVISNQLDYPVAFWQEGIIGAQAKQDIGANKAYVFVPYSICINIYKAKTSEISQIFKKKFFTKHSRSNDHILWVFLLYEKLKGPNSFWFPYFSTLSGYNNLIDWSPEELEELQDKLLVYDNKKWRERLARIWKSVKKIVERYPEYFPPEQDIEAEFIWAWKVCCTRGYAWDGGMLIPLADNLNHGEVYTSYESEQKAVLELFLMNGKTVDVDYSDFLGMNSGPAVEVDKRHNTNRLQKFLLGNSLPPISKVWELDKVLEDFRSSSSEDDERNIAECTSEEESAFESEDLDDVQIKPDEDNYFMMSTGVRTFFKKGEQVLNAYGRLNNRNLLLDYGFAVENNRYDTVYFLLWLPRSGREGLVKLVDIEARSQEYMDYSELYGLKAKRLNLDVFVYFREIMDVPVKNFPSNVEKELEIIDKFLGICLELHDEFPSSLEEDFEILNRNPVARLKSALFYRISQKKIVLNQIKMLETLRKELEGIHRGVELDGHLVGRSLEEIQDVYPLRSYLKSLVSSH